MNSRTKRIFQNLTQAPDIMDTVTNNEETVAVLQISDIEHAVRPDDDESAAVLQVLDIEEEVRAENQEFADSLQNQGSGFCHDFGSDDSVADKDYIPNSFSSDSEMEIPEAIQRVKRKLFTVVTADIHNVDDDLIQLADLIPSSSEQFEKTDKLNRHKTKENLQLPSVTPLASSASKILEQSHISGTRGLPAQLSTPIRNISETRNTVVNSPREFEEVTNRPVAESEIKKRPSKRKRNQQEWKRTEAKKKRLEGLAYTSDVAKKNPEIPERKLQPPCQCKQLKCYEKIKEEDREIIWKHFWKKCTSWDQKRQFAASHVLKDIKARMNTNSNIENDRRKFTFTYFLEMNFTNIKVCQVMFLNTLSVGKKIVQLAVEKKLESGIVEPDRRGHHVPGYKLPEAVKETIRSHISSYPIYESHYSRNKSKKKYLGPEQNIKRMYKQYVKEMSLKNATEKQIGKEWLYRLVFNTEFNLSFKLPGIDTCDDCDRFVRQFKDCNAEEEKVKIQEERKKHLKEADSRYEMKRKDKEDASKVANKRVLYVDLQKCLPTPHLTCTQSFYLRKLWTLNLTVYDCTSKKTSNYVWPENYGGRGGNEFGSCLIKWAEENLDETVEEITVYSDNSTGQNRNGMIVMAYNWILEKHPHLKIINHKFMLKGHTHMEVDHAHSMIEKRKKTLTALELATPRDWAQFVRTCEGKNPFQVTEMTIQDFKDLAALCKTSSAPFLFRKKEFKISETIWWQIKQHMKGILFYKTSLTYNGLDATPFKELSLKRKLKQPLIFPSQLENVRSSEKPISTAKFNDIITLLQWVPNNCHDFFKKLKHTINASDVPEGDEE